MVSRDASEEFWRLLAVTRARKIREGRAATGQEIAELLELYAVAMTTSFRAEAPVRDALVAELHARSDPLAILALSAREREQLHEALRLIDLHSVRHEPIADEPGELKSVRGRKSRWRRVDLETIFVKHPDTPARELARGDELVEEIDHQRISELRNRRDIRVERGRLLLPEGTTAGEPGWVILPKAG
jgi:hypothetical protein